MDNWFKSHVSSPLILQLGQLKERRNFNKKPVLLGGCGRSGTTLLLSILSAHPAFFTFPNETKTFERWVEKDGVLVPDRIDRLYRYLLSAKVSSTNDRWVMKRPKNVLYIKELFQYFGEGTRFIHIVRDPRAVCVSKHPLYPDQYYIDPERYIRDVNAGLEFIDRPSVLTIKYEDLVLKQKELINQLCVFLGEPVNDQIINWFDFATVRTNAAWKDGIKRLSTDPLTNWQKPKYTDRVYEIVNYPGIRELMNTFNYQ